MPTADRRPYSAAGLALPEDVAMDFARAGADGDPFGGLWSGTWGGSLPHSLWVEPAPAADVERVAIYAWGDALQTTRGFVRERATVAGTTLRLATPRMRVAYQATGPDRLYGLWQGPGGARASGTFRRVRPGTASDLAVEHLRLSLEPGRPLGDTTPTLAVTVYQPRDGTPRPLALINHGSADGGGPTGTLLFEAEARFLVDRGFAVAVPMRRGRGRSDGELGEPGCCRDRALCPVELEAGIADLDAVLAHLSAKSWVRPGPVLLAGHSRGGFLSLCFAGERPDRVAAVMNFAGGWVGEMCPAVPFNIERLARAGRATAPSLWLYAENDAYYGPEHVRAMHRRYVEGGGRASCSSSRRWSRTATC